MHHKETIGNSGIGRVGDFYINPNGVRLTWASDELIYLSVNYPATIKNTNIELEYTFIGAMLDFAKIFDVDIENKEKALRQIDRINGKQLEDLYYKGLADIACTIDINSKDCTLYFQMAGTNMRTYDDSNDVEKILPDLLKTADEFISHTKHYFLKKKA